MAQTNIALAASPRREVITYPFGAVRDRIRRADIVGELRGRNYMGCTTGVSPMGQAMYSTTSRTAAVTRAVDDALVRHNQSKICTSAAGCYLQDAIWDSIVSLAELLANRYYTVAASPTYSPTYTTIQPSYSPTYSPAYTAPTAATQYVYGGQSPVPGVPWVTETIARPSVTPSLLSPTASPSFQTLSSRFTSYFSGAPGALGQTVNPVPTTPALPGGWTSAEKWAFALDLVQKGLSWATSYLQAKAERDRLIGMGTQIPQMTAQEVQSLLMQLKMMNPGTSDQQLQNVGAGLLGQPKPSAIPIWIWPIAAGLGVLGILMYMKKR